MAAQPSLIDLVQKSHGAGSLIRIGDVPRVPVEVCSSGVFSLDFALGIGGYPRGRILEVFGNEAAGKTTLALHAAATHQKIGQVAFIDAEHALDIRYAEALGVDTDDLLLCQPDHGEQATGVLLTLVKSGQCSLVLVDSVAALVPKAELDGEAGDSHMGLHARLMSQTMRMLCGAASKTKTTVLFINQLRAKIGVTFGPKTTTTGGNALKFYASVRLDVAKVGQIKDSPDSPPQGNRTQIKVVKNKHAPPFQDTTVDLIWGKGVDYVADVFDQGVRHGVIDQKGAWFSMGGERLGQGGMKAAAALRNNPAWLETVRMAVVAKRLGVPA